MIISFKRKERELIHAAMENIIDDASSEIATGTAALTIEEIKVLTEAIVNAKFIMEKVQVDEER